MEDIVKAIKSEIVSGKIQSGEKLPSERNLQEMFGAGRGTIREALKTLEGMGLLFIKKGRGGGAFITDNAGQIASESLSSLFKVEESNVLDLIEFRRMIEPKMFFYAALNRSVDDLEELRKSLDLSTSMTPTQEKFISVTTGFFRAVAGATHNGYTATFYFKQVIPALAEKAKLVYEIPKCVEISLYFYNQLLSALEEGDAAKSEMISEAYLVQIENNVKNAKNIGIPIGRRKGVVKWGVMLDLSGATLDYSKQNAMGLIDAARYVNEKGGINGRELQLIVHDDKYNLNEGKKAYQRFRDEDKVFGLYVQSTGTNLSLAPMAMRDEIFMFSGSPSATLANPSKFPYYFCLGCTYTDMARMAIKYISETWSNSKRKPKVVFLFPDNPYGWDPLEAVKRYAAGLGVEVGPDQIINWPTLDATSQLRSMQEYDPDFAYISSTAMNTAYLLHDAIRMEIRTKFIGNHRVFNEDLLRIARDFSEGVLGVQPFALFGAEVSGMRKIVDAHNRWHPYHHPNLAYVEGWANILVLAPALKMADEQGDLTRDGLRRALETYREFDAEGLTPPISYYEDDHRSTTKAAIYEIKGGKFRQLRQYMDVERDKEYLPL